MAIQKKRFFFTFIFTILSWGIWMYVLLTVPPENPNNFLSIPVSYIFFFTPLFLSLFLTITFLLGNTRRGFLLSIGIIGLLILQLLKTVNFLTVGLLLAIFIVFELYFSRSRN
jgi:hypothetical protein